MIRPPFLVQIDRRGAPKAVLPLRWINLRDLPSMNEKMRKSA